MLDSLIQNIILQPLIYKLGAQIKNAKNLNTWHKQQISSKHNYRIGIGGQHMGSSITIDKHGTALQDWLQIQQKLLQIQIQFKLPSSSSSSSSSFNINNNNNNNAHISIWRIAYDQIDHSISTVPVLLDGGNAISSINGINNDKSRGYNVIGNGNFQAVFSCEDGYVVSLVKKGNYQPDYLIDSNVQTIISCLFINIQQNTMQTCMAKGCLKDTSNLDKPEKYQYFTYAFLGKRAKNSIKLATISYAHKLGTFLNNPQRIRILTGGGVFRNKKLQIGSVSPLIKRKNFIQKNLQQYQSIHIISQLCKKNIEQSINEGLNNFNAQFSLFKIKPKMPIPSADPIAQSQAGFGFSQIHYNQNQRKSTTNSHHSHISSTSNNLSNISYNNYVSNQSNSSNPPSFPSTNPTVNPSIPPLSSSAPSPNKPPKPPILKLPLKPSVFSQPTYDQLAQQQKQQKYEMRGTARHQLKMQKFSQDCTLIVEGLYLSGEKVAKDWAMLQRYGIKQIVNCAADYCYNWFQGKGIGYLSFFIKDSQSQNIQSLFYRVIQFVNKAISNKKNVLIHCIQGISRSVSFVIAYLIFINGYDYKKAQAFVKEKRAIACPNNGFMVELIQFYKRLHEKYGSLGGPRAFLVSYHCQQTPHFITARLIKQKLYQTDGKKCIGLDERGIYIIQTQQIVYLWVGSKCQDEKKMKAYWTYAQSYIKKLQQHEKAPMKIKAIHQGNQGKDFLSLWNLQQLPGQYTNPEYDRLFTQQKPAPKPGYLRKHYQRSQQQEQQQQNSNSPIKQQPQPSQQQQQPQQHDYIAKLFIHPNSTPLSIFQLQDLVGLCLLVKSNSEKIKIFVYRGKGWADNDGEPSKDKSKGVNGRGRQGEMEEEKDKQIENFLDAVIRQNYASYGEDDIIIVDQGEDGDGFSQEFLSCFS